MKLILRNDVQGLGNRGDTVEVKPGYGRNFLLPRGLALPVTAGNMRAITRERERALLRDTKDMGAAQILAERLAGVSITIARKVGEDQALFGSVTAAEIAEKLTEAGFSIDRKQVLVAEPIRMLGIYDVPVMLHSKVRPTVKLWVVKE